MKGGGIVINRNRLVGKIAENGFTQGDVARALGLSANTFSARINGKSYFNTNEVERMCQILRITDDAEKAQIFLYQSSHNRDVSV